MTTHRTHFILHHKQNLKHIYQIMSKKKYTQIQFNHRQFRKCKSTTQTPPFQTKNHKLDIKNHHKNKPPRSIKAPNIQHYRSNPHSQ